MESAMIRFAFTLIFSFAAVVCQAQEHLRFMDILLDGDLDSFCSKLIKDKGLVAGTMTDGEQYMNMETKKLMGDFYGIKGCTYYVRKHERLDNVTSVIVEDTLHVLSKADESRLVSLLDRNYGSHEKDSILNSVWYKWKTTSGEVELGVHKEGFKIYYIDNAEEDVNKQLWEEFNRKRERQTIKEICGIPFGSSYEKAEEVLENKFGEKSFLSDMTKIYYRNENYAGIFFDNIIFLFQSDGYKSYMNGCIFILEATSLRQAKEKQEMLYKKLSYKYDMKEGEDDNGNKFYYGGRSPVPFDGFGFSIEIIKFENQPDVPYAARLIYGRYNYVKEEF